MPMKKPRTRRSKTAPSVKRRRSRFLDNVDDIVLDQYDLLKKFVTEHGKIIPARLTGASAKQQRQIRRGVRRARVVGIIP